MNYRSVSNIDGEQLIVHGGFRGELERIVKKCWTSASPGSRDDVLNKLAAHPYLVFDDQLAGAQAKRREFYKKAALLFEKLKEDFSTNSIVLTGHNNGTDRIDSSKLSRKIFLRKVAPETLLLQIERHPYRGAAFHVNQFWLYNASTKTCELIGNETILVPKLDATLVQKNGIWGQPTSKREEFQDLITSLLGPCGLTAFQNKTAFQPDLLLDPSQIISDECESRLGKPIEQPRVTKTKNRKTAVVGAMSLNMTKGMVLHGVPSDFFLYKLEEQFNDNCSGATVILDKGSRTVRVSLPSLQHDLEVTFGKGSELEIKCGTTKRCGELIHKRGLASFETDYSLSVEIGGVEYSLPKLVDLFG